MSNIFKSIDETPIALVKNIFYSRDGVRLLTVTCPFCGKEHTHGGGLVTEPVSAGTRVNHCVTGNPGAGDLYELVVPDNLIDIEREKQELEMLRRREQRLARKQRNHGGNNE